MVMSITPREADLLAFLKSHSGGTGLMPSFEEIMEAMGLKSKSGVHRLLGGLEVRGRIRRMKGHARAIEILDKEPVDLRAALRAVNEAAYAAARMASKEQHPFAETLRRIALDTDRLMDEAA